MRKGVPPDIVQKSALAVDGSEPSKTAVPQAIDLAAKSQGGVLIVRVHQKVSVTRETDGIESGGAPGATAVTTRRGEPRPV